MILSLLAVTACGGEDLVTDDEATMFQDTVTDQIPEMRAYPDDVFKGIASNVCPILNPKNTAATNAMGVLGNYNEIPAAKRALVVGIAAGSACPEFKDKIN